MDDPSTMKVLGWRGETDMLSDPTDELLSVADMRQV